MILLECIKLFPDEMYHVCLLECDMCACLVTSEFGHLCLLEYVMCAFSNVQYIAN